MPTATVELCHPAGRTRGLAGTHDRQAFACGASKTDAETCPSGLPPTYPKWGITCRNVVMPNHQWVMISVVVLGAMQLCLRSCADAHMSETICAKAAAAP